MKKLPTEWEKTFANKVSDKGFISKINKRLLKFIIKLKKNFNNPIKIWAENLK